MTEAQHKQTKKLHETPGEVQEQVAILIGATVLHLYAEAYPEDDRLQLALIAAIDLVLSTGQADFDPREEFLEGALEAAKDTTRPSREDGTTEAAYALYGAVNLDADEVSENVIGARWAAHLSHNEDAINSEREFYGVNDTVIREIEVLLLQTNEARLQALEELREDLRSQTGQA